jgi:hypothetical protein
VHVDENIRLLVFISQTHVYSDFINKVKYIYIVTPVVTCLLSQGRVRRLQVVSDTNLPRVRLSATSN